MSTRDQIELSFLSSPMDRRRFLALGLGAAALAACTPTTGSSQPAGGTSGSNRRLADSVTYAAQTITDTLDPHGTLSNSGFMGARQVFDALISYDDKGEKFVPQLASEWRRIDPQTYEFKLRDDVKFSNGEPFNAEVVKFSFERIKGSTDPLHTNAKTNITLVSEVEVVNSTTVRIKTSAADPIFLNRMTLVFMVPPKYVRDGGDLKTKPIGTGSFRVTEFVTTNRIMLEAWDETWRGKPTVKSARILAIPEEAAITAALKTGEVDIVYGIGGDKVAGLRSDFNSMAIPGGSCTVKGIIPTNPVFADKRVREALNLAINREEIVQRIFGGFGKVANSQLLQPGFVGYHDKLAPIGFDPERARSLIRQAGAEGVETPIGAVAATRPLSEAVAGFLNAVGLKASVKIYEFPVFVQQILQKSENPLVGFRTDYFTTRDFDAAGANFGTRPPGFQDFFVNEEFDRTYAQAKTELDEEKRKNMILRMAELMREEYAALFIAYQDYTAVFSKRIAKLRIPYDTATRLAEVEKEA